MIFLIAALTSYMKQVNHTLSLSGSSEISYRYGYDHNSCTTIINDYGTYEGMIACSFTGCFLYCFVGLVFIGGFRVPNSLTEVLAGTLQDGERQRPI